MIFRDSDGVWRLTDDFIRTDGKIAALAVRSFQKEMCRLGMESIEDSKEQRDISTITVSSSKACMELIRKDWLNSEERFCR